jgi:hypothetical protein
MTHHPSFHLPEDEAFDDLVRQALGAELNRLAGPSTEVWRALTARIQFEPGLLTSDVNTKLEIEPRTDYHLRRVSARARRREGPRRLR